MSIVYPLFVQVDYMVLADSKSTWSQDKHFFKNILVNDLSTVRSLIHNDPSLLLKLVYLSVSSPFSCTTKLPTQSTNSFKLKVSCHRWQDAEETCWGRPLQPVLQPSPSLGVKLMWWKVKSRFWVTFALLPHISQTEGFLYSAMMVTNQYPVWNVKPSSLWERGGGRAVWGVQMHVSKIFPYVAGISPPGKLQTVGMCIWNMQKHIAMSKQYLKN